MKAQPIQKHRHPSTQSQTPHGNDNGHLSHSQNYTQRRGLCLPWKEESCPKWKWPNTSSNDQTQAVMTTVGFWRVKVALWQATALGNACLWTVIVEIHLVTRFINYGGAMGDSLVFIYILYVIFTHKIHPCTLWFVLYTDRSLAVEFAIILPWTLSVGLCTVCATMAGLAIIATKCTWLHSRRLDIRIRARAWRPLPLLVCYWLPLFTLDTNGSVHRGKIWSNRDKWYVFFDWFDVFFFKYKLYLCAVLNYFYFDTKTNDMI